MEKNMKIENEIKTLNQYKGMVRKMAHKWKREPRITFEDLMSEGNIAVIKACRNYDETRGAKFSTYVYHSIKNSIIGYVKSNSLMMHCSTHHQKKEGERDRAIRQEKNTVSLDKPMESGFSVGSIIEASGLSPLDAALKKEEWSMLEDAIANTLDAREQRIVREGNRWFGLKTLEDLSCDFGVSRQRVHQIQQGVFDKLSRRLSGVGD
jgi:RNA polymerase sigma factor (sigma-70 family)